MSALMPPFMVAAGVLLLAGLLKLRSPLGTSRALAAVGWPAGPAFVRAVGLAEIALGALCLVSPSRPGALALGLVYLALAGFGLRLVRAARGPAPCGCFGDGDVPASRGHVALNLLAAAVCLLAALASPAGWGALDTSPLATAIVALGVGCGVYLSYLAFTLLPAVWGAYAPASEPEARR